MKGDGWKRLFMVVGLLLALFEASHVAQVEAAWGSTGWQTVPATPSQEGRDVLAGDTVMTGSYIAIAFADALAGVYTFGLPALSARGLEGVTLVPTANVGLVRRMTLAQLQALASAGWDVASHLDNGGDCTQMPPQELLSRLQASHDWLVEHGFVQGARIFAPPSQRWAPELTPLATQAGYDVVLVSQKRGGIVPQNLAPVWASSANKIALEQIASAIQNAKSTPGRLLILSFHDVVQSNPVGTQADVQRLQAVLDLAVASGLPIVTVSDLMSGD